MIGTNVSNDSILLFVYSLKISAGWMRIFQVISETLTNDIYKFLLVNFENSNVHQGNIHCRQVFLDAFTLERENIF